MVTETLQEVFPHTHQERGSSSGGIQSEEEILQTRFPGPFQPHLSDLIGASDVGLSRVEKDERVRRKLPDQAAKESVASCHCQRRETSDHVIGEP
jgi:hypothetical protein